MRSYNRQLRRKVLIVPYAGNRFLMVKDAKSGEWGFISGGVKKGESFLNAANRELCEETSGVFNDIGNVYSSFTFRTWYRPCELLKMDRQKQEQVESLYMVYMVPMNAQLCTANVTQTFVPNNEVTDLRVQTFDEAVNVWDFCNEVYNTKIMQKMQEIGDVMWWASQVVP